MFVFIFTFVLFSVLLNELVRIKFHRKLFIMLHSEEEIRVKGTYLEGFGDDVVVAASMFSVFILTVVFVFYK